MSSQTGPNSNGCWSPFYGPEPLDEQLPDTCEHPLGSWRRPGPLWAVTV